MGKRFWSTVIVTGLVATGFAQIMVARAATKVPAKVQIEDPVGDGNFLNDQDTYGTPAEGTGDNATAADAGSVSDFIKVWFSNAKKTISLHILTERPPPATSTVYYRVASNPGKGEIGENTLRGCLNWRMVFAGQQTVQGQTVDTSTYRAPDPSKPASIAEFEDVCNVEGRQTKEVKLTVEELEDGTGITTMTVPRSFSPLFSKGGKITNPYAISRIAFGHQGTELPTGGNFAALGQSDSTKRGTEYVIKDKKKKKRRRR